MKRLLAAGAAVLLAVGLAAGAHATTAAPNPHGRSDACASCHATPTGGAVRAEAETCLSCHPEGDPHPSDVTPKSVHVPPSWPLVDGKVTCATCHAEPACDEERDDAAPFLRGGRVDRIGAFCEQCHDAGGMNRVNPHHPAEPRDPTDPSCAACHAGIPETGVAPDASRLRVSPAAACRTCHPGEVHVGVREHVDVRIEGTAPAGLPLTVDQRIACWTCHEVHGGPAPEAPRRKASADAIRALALGAPTTAATPHGALLTPTPGGLCQACHGDGP